MSARSPASPTWTTSTVDANTVKLSPLGHEIEVKRPSSAGGAVEADELPAGALIGMYGRFAGEPRNKVLPAVREARSVRAFVCKFPGCGKAFSDYRTLAAHHADEHHDKPRLRTPAPAVDQRVQPFWPENVPWRKYTAEQLEEAEQTAGIGAPYVCMICNPPKRFARRDFYESHVRVIHPHAHKGEKYVEREREKKERERERGREGGREGGRERQRAKTHASPPALSQQTCSSIQMWNCWECP